jgi:hypothetical protein
MSKSEVVSLRVPSEIYEVIEALTSNTSATRNTVVLDLITSSPNYSAYVRNNQPALNLPISTEKKIDIILSRLEELTRPSIPSIDPEPIREALRLLEAIITAKEEKIKGFTTNSFAQGFTVLLQATSNLKATLHPTPVQYDGEVSK